MAEVSTKGRGWQGAVLKLMGGDDFQFTVTSTETVTDHFVRLGFTGGGLLAKATVHPTMWVRLWFDVDGKLHQRGYTLVDPDVGADTFYLEFAIHEGPAAAWAVAAKPGDTINATLMGSKFAMPDAAPERYILVGDTAALPAVNSLLDARSATHPDTPATVWMEYQYESDKDLTLRVRPQDTVTWIARERDGSALVDAVKAAAFPADRHFGWVALDAVSTRAVAASFKGDYKIPKKAVKAMAYWTQGKASG